ncbi:MAG: methionine--tRNA ligase [Minisyncoccia bacterium]
MQKQKYFYITTTLPYVNAQPHIGHALEFVRADSIARYKKINGYNVFFNTGTDEHGQKLLEAANKKNINIKNYVDTNSQVFKKLLVILGISENINFIRTTDPNHIKAAQEFWKRVEKNGFIYKAKYQVRYCVGCELEKFDSDLVDGRCQYHPTLDIQIINEDNYFFRLSDFQDRLISLFEKNINFILPESRYNEAKNFISHGLKDFSISRLKSKMSWGIPVPGDDEHVMYVWFDALTSYINALGWPENVEIFKKYWVNGTPVQYCGQDNLRQQSIIWQAMLMAANLPNSNKIIVNGFVLGEGGVKMSKTAGNVIDPIKLVENYGKDAVRLYLLKNIHPWNGSPISYKSFHLTYEAELVNGLGNLTSRLLNMSEKYLNEPVSFPDKFESKEWFDHFEDYRMDLVTEFIWGKIYKLDKSISETEPFKLVSTDLPKAQMLLKEYARDLYTIAQMLEPLLPETSRQVKGLIKQNKKPRAPLFPRKRMLK